MPAVRFLAEGLVQGVGFREFVRREAVRSGLSGWVRNLPDGRVEGEVQGKDLALQTFLGFLRKGPPGSRVTGLQTENLPENSQISGFRIRF